MPRLLHIIASRPKAFRFNTEKAQSAKRCGPVKKVPGSIWSRLGSMQKGEGRNVISEFSASGGPTCSSDRPLDAGGVVAARQLPPVIRVGECGRTRRVATSS